MKIRRGFVTNSSSSSYIIAKKKDATLADIKNSLLKVRDNAKSFLIEQHKWIDLEPDVEESIRKEDYDIRESNIIKICHGMQIEPFDLFQTSEEILVLEKDEEIQAILEARSHPEEYREIMLEYLHSLKRIAERSK